MKKINLILLLILCAVPCFAGSHSVNIVGPGSSSAPLSVSDNFNAYSDGPLTGSWTAINSETGLSALSAEATTSASGRAGSYWNANTFGADQCAQVELTTVPINSRQPQLKLRVSTGAETYYELALNSPNMLINKKVAGTNTNITTTSVTFARYDVMKFCAIGTSLTAYINDVEVTALATTDTDISTGQPGLGFYNGSSLVAMDNWSAWEN